MNDKIILTDGQETWNLTKEQYNLYTSIESCEVCTNYIKGTCGKCLTGLENNYKLALILEDVNNA